MTAGLQLSPTYRADCWQPIHLELQNAGAAAVQGTAVVPLADPQAPAAMTLPFTVPPRSRVSATVWAYFPPPFTLTAQQARKGEVAPPLSVAEFRGRDGALLSRAQVVGVPLSRAAAGPGPGSSDDGQRGELVLVVGQREEADDELYEATWLIGELGEASGVPMAVANADPDRFPRHAAGLTGIKAVVLDALHPQTFDLAQREALLDYLRGGGIAVLAAPRQSIADAGSWLAPLLPVNLVGVREVSQINYATSAGDDNTTLKLQPVKIVEAAPADGGEVLLRDRDYVHVAARRVGLGKVVFTSFPINALDSSQPQTAMLWEQLLELRQPRWDWNQSQLGDVRHEVISSMMGRKVAPWAVAAGVAGGYVALVLLAQGIFLGPNRPKAFAASVAGAVLLACVLVVMGMTRRADQALQSAQLSVVDVSRHGGGWGRESVAFVGADDPDMTLKGETDAVMIRPALADARNRPMIRQQPFVAEKAQVFADRVERVWEASGPLHPTARLRATVSFDPNGLTLDVDNALGQRIESPLLVYEGRALTMNDLPAGRSTVRSLRVNPRGDFTIGGVLASDQAKRRAMIAQASFAPPAGAAADPLAATSHAPLVGWLPDAPDPGLITASHEPKERKSMTMVRAPVEIVSPPAGSKVSVPAALVRINPGRLPYDRGKGETVPSQQDGEYDVTFAPPPQIGRVRPTRVTLGLRVSLPAHTLSVRKGSNRASPAVEWQREVGARELTIDCAPGDYDDRGRVTLHLNVRSQNAAGGSGIVPWQIKDLGMSFDAAEVIGPPDPIVLDDPLDAPRGSPRAADAPTTREEGDAEETD